MTGGRVSELLGRKPAEKAEVGRKVASEPVAKIDMGTGALAADVVRHIHPARGVFGPRGVSGRISARACARAGRCRARWQEFSDQYAHAREGGHTFQPFHLDRALTDLTLPQRENSPPRQGGSRSAASSQLRQRHSFSLTEP